MPYATDKMLKKSWLKISCMDSPTILQLWFNIFVDTCREKGNIYGPVPGSDCTKFTQATDSLPPQEHSCPAGLRFNTAQCVCDWPHNFECTI